MTKKYDAFISDLKELCEKHKVSLDQYEYEQFGVFDFGEGRFELADILDDKTTE